MAKPATRPDRGLSLKTSRRRCPRFIEVSSKNSEAGLGDFEPRANAAFAAEKLRLNPPLAAIVRDERDACRTLRRREDGVEPERLPAIVEGVEQTCAVTVQVNHMRMIGRILE